MKAQTDVPCRTVIVAKSPLGKPPNASMAPRKTPNIPVVEFPALNRVLHDLNVLLFTTPLGAARP